MAAQDNSPPPQHDPKDGAEAAEEETIKAESDVIDADPTTDPVVKEKPSLWRPQRYRHGSASKTPRRRWPLLTLVVSGTATVTSLGVVYFAWLAWLLSDRPAPWRDPDGWGNFLSHVDGSEMFDAARTTATILAIIGIGGAALVGYRRQDTAERAHEVAIEAQQTAAGQLHLDSRKYELDRERHRLETFRRTDDRERELRDRFTTIAEQLGSDKNYAVRHAGAYALASLADDWHRFNNDSERQVCIDLLCAQLRSPRQQIEVIDEGAPTWIESREDREVRNTIVALIRSHRPASSEVDEHQSWKACHLDLSGANLSGVNLERIDLSGANLEDADLTGALVSRSNLSDAAMTRATLTAAEFTFSKMPGVRLFRAKAESEIDRVQQAAVEFGQCDLRRANFVGASLPHAQFPESNLTDAHFGGSHIWGANFRNATLTGATLWIKLRNVRFRDADLRGAIFSSGLGKLASQAEFELVDFEGALHDETTKWPYGVVPFDLRSKEGVADDPRDSSAP